MKIIKPILILLSFCGLSFHNAYSKLQVLLYIFWSTFCTIFAFGVWIYVYENLNHLSTVFEVFEFGIGVLMALSKSYLYISYKAKYFQLYYKLQNNTILSKTFCCTNTYHNNYFCITPITGTESGSKCYQLAEKQSKYFFACIATSSFFTAFYLIFAPLIQIFFKYIKGTLRLTDIVQPIPTSYAIFDNESSPTFEIKYIISSISLCGCCIFEIGIDSLFVGIGFYIVAGFKDLQIMILELDDIIKSEMCERNDITLKKSFKFYIKMVKCIQYHNFMLECQNVLQEVNTTIIFATAVAVSFILCSALFRLTRATIDEFLLLTVLAVAANFMILAYCYVGNLITTEGLNVAKTAYNGLWYLCSARERRLYLQLIQFSQKTRFINGLYFFDCSLETFSKIIQASFSFTAVMRSLG